jgi:hypothetical protein
LSLYGRYEFTSGREIAKQNRKTNEKQYDTAHLVLPLKAGQKNFSGGLGGFS